MDYITIGLIIIFLFIVSYFRSTIRRWMDLGEHDEHSSLIQKYLLNGGDIGGADDTGKGDRPKLGGKPKLWIHTRYEINARKWQSFQTRNTRDLNQPYIYLCIQSIVAHCGRDFHVCLIDDTAFSKLLPETGTQFMGLETMADPEKSHLRKIALLKLLHYYGGVVVPDSFVCTRNLAELYSAETAGGQAFVGERPNARCHVVKEAKRQRPFLPSTYFMGSLRKNAEVAGLITELEASRDGRQFSSEGDFQGWAEWWLADAVADGRLKLVDGRLLGVKTVSGRPVLIEDLLGEKTPAIDPAGFGVYLPEDELLIRTHYQWFAVLSVEEILGSRMYVARVFKEALSGSEPLPRFSA